MELAQIYVSPVRFFCITIGDNTQIWTERGWYWNAGSNRQRAGRKKERIAPRQQAQSGTGFVLEALQ